MAEQRLESRRVRVLVCGEALRGDDGAALEAVAHLPARVRRVADVRLVGQLGAEHLLGVAREAPCIVADAVVGVPAGRVVVRPLSEVRGHAGPGLRSTHALPPGETIALAEALGADLRGSLLVGMGGGEFRLGHDLSPEARAGVPRFARELGRAVLELATHGAGDAQADPPDGPLGPSAPVGSALPDGGGRTDPCAGSRRSRARTR